MNGKFCALFGVMCLTLTGCCVKGPIVFVVPPNANCQDVAEIESEHPEVEVKHLSHDEWAEQVEGWLVHD